LKRSPKSVLIVDDDPRFTSLLKDALVAENVSVTIAPTGADASVEAELGSFQLVVLDGQLPDTDGLSWLALMRPKLEETPVMFVSATWRDTATHQKLVQELGVNCIVHKPVSIEVIVDEVLRLLRTDARKLDPAETKLSRLTANYVSEITAEFQTIEDIVRYAPEDVSTYKIDSLQNAAHKIHGTAAIYGFDEIGRIAAVIEQDLQAVLSTDILDSSRRSKLLLLLGRAAEEIKHWTTITRERVLDIAEEELYQARLVVPGSKKVLIVDDDIFLLKRLEQLLAAENILLNSYSDSKQVVQGMQHFKPDVVVLDVNMPDFDGFEVCVQIRSKDLTIPIILISADASAESKAKASGATVFEAKPIKNMRFVGLIKSLLER